MQWAGDLTRPRRRLLWSILMVLLGALAGAACSNKSYHATTLPNQYAAPPPRPDQVDLSRLTHATARKDLIQPGDLIEITVATGIDEPEIWPGRVTPDGNVHLPLVGPVRLAGLQLQEAEEVIHSASVQRGLYRDPQISIQVKSRRSNKVTVVGAVSQPGSYELPVANSDLLAAIVAAGGLSEDADTVVEVQRPSFQRMAGLSAIGQSGTELAGYQQDAGGPDGVRSTRIDLLKSSDNPHEDWRLEDGSVVMIMKKPEQNIFVMGLVRKPNQFELPTTRDVRLLDALAMAGGRTMEIADKVRIIRTLPGETEPIVINASVREAKQNTEANIRLAAGDVVSVEETPLTFALDTIRNFIRFGFSSAIPGM